MRNATKAACLSTLNSYVAAETMNCSGYFQSPDRSHKQIETEGHKAIKGGGSLQSKSMCPADGSSHHSAVARQKCGPSIFRLPRFLRVLESGFLGEIY